MAVTLGPNGLTGDGGGVEVSTGNLTTLGLNTSGELGNIICPLPSGYDYFRLFMRWNNTTAGTASGRMFLVAFGGTQLSCEGNAWRLRRGNAGSQNGSLDNVHNGSSLWTLIATDADPATLNNLVVDIDGQSGYRPAIIWDGNYTHASQGSSRMLGTMHFNSVTRYTGVGINLDNLAVVNFEYRLVGYSL